MKETWGRTESDLSVRNLRRLPLIQVFSNKKPNIKRGQANRLKARNTKRQSLPLASLYWNVYDAQANK